MHRPDFPHYVYVLVRKDLPLRHQLVQAVHASMEAAYLFPSEAPWLVVCSVSNEADLIAASNELSRNGVSNALFFEPDHDLGSTALATEPVRGAARKHLRKYRLWGE